MKTQEKIYTIISKLSPENIALNISDFVSLIQQKGLNPEIEREFLARGFYGTYFGTNVWISKIVKPGSVHISNQENAQTFHNIDWSPTIYLNWVETEDGVEKIEKMWKMKAFW